MEKPPDMVWPLPPETPRIKFEDIIIGSIDATGWKSGNLSTILLGQDREFGFTKPSFVAVRGDVMYVTDIGCLHVFDFKHKKYSRFGGDVLNTPTGVALSPSGAIYVADSTADEIFIFSPGGVLIGQIKGVSTPGGIAFDNTRGRLICCETRKHDLAVFDAAGKLLFNIGKRGNGPGEFNFPYSVAVDREGRILVVDSGNFRVQVLAPDGSFIRAFGSVGILPGMFARPKGIALDSEGHLYVVDSAFGNFQIFDESGNIYLAVGSNGTDPGEFHLPTSIAINERDRIYVVDQLNRRIQVFQYLKDGG